jgi:outer membrane protein OmpA-like peptidoglycan-associated protein
MKNSFWISLPLAAALMLPALAQQQTTPSQDQPPAPASQDSSSRSMQSTQPAQPAQTQATQPAQSTAAATDQQAASPRQPLTFERHEGFWGKINPFARKKYVQRQLGPIRDRVNELDELTSQNAKAIKDVDSRAQEGIRVASAKANEADMHAIDAGNRAQTAHQTAQQASSKLQTMEQVVGNIDQYQPATTAEIRFRSGQTALSKKAKAALDEMAEPLKDQKGYIIEVQGFSSGSGRAAIENSQNMAQSVVRYLVLNHEIPVYRIYLIGMGNTPLPATAEGERPRRIRGGRVEVALLKNNIDQLSTEPIVTPSSAPSNQGGTTGAATSSSGQVQSTQPDQSSPAAAQPAQPSPNEQVPPKQ